MGGGLVLFSTKESHLEVESLLWINTPVIKLSEEAWKSLSRGKYIWKEMYIYL